MVMGPVSSYKLKKDPWKNDLLNKDSIAEPCSKTMTAKNQYRRKVLANG